jgi:hypothetical protein
MTRNASRTTHSSESAAKTSSDQDGGDRRMSSKSVSSILSRYGKARMCLKSAVQTKLTVNQPGDEFEREADRVADQVMRMPEPEIQRQVDEEEEEKLLQTKRASENNVTTTKPSIVHDVLRSPGKPLDADTRAFMEPRFGRDFCDVRVHTDAQAAESARELDARAYTVGNDVVFNLGQYSPESSGGKQLIAHELAHVEQQTTPQSTSCGLSIRGEEVRIKRAFTCSPSDSEMLLRQEEYEGAEQPTEEGIDRGIAEGYYNIIVNARSLEQIKSQVEARAEGDLGLLGADAVVISLSGAAGRGVGGGAGFEWVYSPVFGWATFFQAGLGLISGKGGGIALEVGFIWDLKDPEDYTELFLEAAVTGGPGHFGMKPGMASFSGSVTPEDLIFYPITEGEMRQPRALKGGGGYGSKGFQMSLLVEWFWLISGSAPETEITEEETEEVEFTETESPAVESAWEKQVSEWKRKEAVAKFTDGKFVRIYHKHRARIMKLILRDLRKRRKTKVSMPPQGTLTLPGLREVRWWDCFLNSDEETYTDELARMKISPKKLTVPLSDAVFEVWNFLDVDPPCPYFNKLYKRALKRHMKGLN